MLWHSLLTASQLGARRVVVVTRPRWRVIRASVNEFSLKGTNLKEVRTVFLRSSTAGPVETLLRVLPRAPDDFCVVLGDDFTKGNNVGALGEALRDREVVAAELVVRDDIPERIKQACEVRLTSGGRIESILEKPRRPSGNLRGCGVYFFRGKAFSGLLSIAGRSGRPMSMTDLVAAATRSKAAASVLLDGVNVNVNTLADYVSVLTIEGTNVDQPL